MYNIGKASTYYPDAVKKTAIFKVIIKYTNAILKKRYPAAGCHA
jgi:hypothetical protein